MKAGFAFRQRQLRYKQVWLSGLLLGLSVMALAQSASEEEAVAQDPSALHDTVRARQLMGKGFRLISIQNDSADYYLRFGIELSKQYDAPSLTLLGYNALLDLLIAQGKLDSMLSLSGKLVAIPNLSAFIDTHYNAYSTTWIHRAAALRAAGAYEEGIYAAGKALVAADSIQDGATQMSALTELGVLYGEFGDLEKSLECVVETEKIADGLNLPLEMRDYIRSVNLANMAILYDKLGRNEEALEAYTASNRLFVQQGQPRRLGYGYISLATYYESQEELDSAIHYATKSLALFQEVGEETAEIHGLISLAELEVQANRIGQATTRLDSAYALLSKTNDLKNLRRYYHARALWAEKQGDFATALSFTRQAHTLQDSMLNKEKVEAVAHWKILYDLEKKDNEILQLAETNLQQTLALKQQDQLIFGLMIGFVLVVIFVVMAILINRQREQLRTQRATFEAAAEAELSAQTRIAKDLHDSMGSILSAIARKVEPSNKQIDLSATHAMVIQAAEEMRRISHNLMPEELTSFGLQETLENLFYRLAKPDLALNVFVHSPLDHLPLMMQVQVYRIIQELVANAIKHAQASQITAYLTAHEDQLSILVEDDGIGYEVDKITAGIGLKSIESRVQLLGGQLTVSSSIEEGTVNHLVLPIASKHSSHSLKRD